MWPKQVLTIYVYVVHNMVRTENDRDNGNPKYITLWAKEKSVREEKKFSIFFTFDFFFFFFGSLIRNKNSREFFYFFFYASNTKALPERERRPYVNVKLPNHCLTGYLQFFFHHGNRIWGKKKKKGIGTHRLWEKGSKK